MTQVTERGSTSRARPRKRRVHTFNIDTTVLEALDMLARKRRSTRTELIEQAVTEWLALPDDQTPPLPVREPVHPRRLANVSIRCYDEDWDALSEKEARLSPGLPRGRVTVAAEAAIRHWLLAGTLPVPRRNERRALKEAQDALRAGLGGREPAAGGQAPGDRTEPLEAARRDLAARGMPVIPASELNRPAVPEGTAVFRSYAPEDAAFIPPPVPVPAVPAARAKKGLKRGKHDPGCTSRIPEGSYCKTCRRTV